MDNTQLQIGCFKNQAMKVKARPVKVGDYTPNQSISTLQYDPSGNMIAVGTYDGSIKVFNSTSGGINSTLQQAHNEDDEDQYVVTSVRWRPTRNSGQPKSNNILTSICSNGLIQHWSMNGNRGSQIVEIQTHRDMGWSLNAMDYTSDGQYFCAAGEDHNIHVYDFETSQLVSSMHSRGIRIPGHSNRVFSVKGHPTDPNILVSGGWDGSIKLYDIREGYPLVSMSGPCMSGDSIDIFDDMIVTGSTRNKDEMQMFSIAHMQRVYTWKFNEKTKDFDSGQILSTRFSNDGNLIFAGGAGMNEIRAFMNNSDSTADFKVQMDIKGLPSAVFCMDTNPNPEKKQFTFGLGNGQIYSINYEIEENNTEFQPYQGNFATAAQVILGPAQKLRKTFYF